MSSGIRGGGGYHDQLQYEIDMSHKHVNHNRNYIPPQQQQQQQQQQAASTVSAAAPYYYNFDSPPATRSTRTGNFGNPGSNHVSIACFCDHLKDFIVLGLVAAFLIFAGYICYNLLDDN